MKKIKSLIFILLMTLSIMPVSSYAAESNLIQDAQLSLKSTENPKRLEIICRLTEPINLSKGSSNIIYEYFTKDSLGNLEAVPYKKDKSWSGYLNSYDYYPAGEHKYSSGAENAAYPDTVPVAKIYTSTRTSSSIDVTSIAAVRVTVLREDGSGEKVTIYSDGTTSTIEKIEVIIGDEDKDTGIRLDTTTAELPSNTVLIANPLTTGTIYNIVSSALTDVNVNNFIAFEIKLESNGVEIQPNGMVKISIPIPEIFYNADLAVFRIDDDGTKTPYSVAETAIDGVRYITFETEHFSTYVLADITDTEKDETPKTGIVF